MEEKGKKEDVRETTLMIYYRHSWITGWRPGKSIIGTTEIIPLPSLCHPDVVTKQLLAQILDSYISRFHSKTTWMLSQIIKWSIYSRGRESAITFNGKYVSTWLATTLNSSLQQYPSVHAEVLLRYGQINLQGEGKFASRACACEKAAVNNNDLNRCRTAWHGIKGLWCTAATISGRSSVPPAH